jgi:hypothetical protein
MSCLLPPPLPQQSCQCLSPTPSGARAETIFGTTTLPAAATISGFHKLKSSVPCQSLCSRQWSHLACWRGCLQRGTRLQSSWLTQLLLRLLLVLLLLDSLSSCCRICCIFCCAYRPNSLFSNRLETRPILVTPNGSQPRPSQRQFG